VSANRIDEEEDSLDGDFNDINVTPFIDVILVLLIIFMVAAPLATIQIPVNLPSLAATPEPMAPDPVTITVHTDLSVSVGESVVSLEQLGPAVLAATRSDHETRLHLLADRAISYGDLMDVMARLKEEGYFKVVLLVRDGAGGQ